MRNPVLILLSVLILCACTKDVAYNPPTFPVEKELKGTCLSDDLMFSYAYDMSVDSDFVYILALADDRWVQVYDRHTGEHLGAFVGQGQGPGEVHTGASMTLNVEKNRLSVYDQSQRRLVTYAISRTGDTSVLTFETGINLMEQQGAIRNAWLLENSLLVNGQLGSQGVGPKRFQLLQNGQVVTAYNEFPVEPKEQQFTFLSPQVCFSPSFERMATGTLYGGILEVFRLGDKEISLIGCSKFYEPKVNLGSGDIQPETGMKYGFSSICASEEQIYAVLIGDEDPNQINRISVFDWQGNGVIRYHTEQLVFKLAYTEDVPEKLYALTFDPSQGFSLYCYDIEE